MRRPAATPSALIDRKIAKKRLEVEIRQWKLNDTERQRLEIMADGHRKFQRIERLIAERQLLMVPAPQAQPQPMFNANQGVNALAGQVAQNQNLPAGNQNLPAGNQNLPAGNQNLPAGNQNLPAGNQNLPAGNQNGMEQEEVYVEGGTNLFLIYIKIF
jgi:hypothetical protein